MLLTSFSHLPDAITKMRDGKKASFFHPKPPAANNAASSHPPHSLYHIMLTQSPCLLSVCLPMSLGDQKAVPQSFASPHLSWTPLLQWDHIGAGGEQIAFAEREGESFAPSQFSPFLISSEKE